MTEDPGGLCPLEQIAGLLQAVSELSLRPDLWRSQNRFYEWVNTRLPEIRVRAEAGDTEALRCLQLADRVAEHLAVEVPE